MDVIYPNTCLVWVCSQMANTAPGITYHLYGNNVNLSPSTTLMNFMAMDTVFPPKIISPSAWGFPGVTANVGSLQAPLQSWINLSGVDQHVFGYFATDGTGLILFQCSTVPNGPQIVRPNGVFVVQPVLGAYSGSQA